MKRDAFAALLLLTACAGTTSLPAHAPSFARHAAASVCPCLYVADEGGDSINVYPVGSSGNVAPIQYIAGSNTQLNRPESVAVDSGGNMYVADTAFGDGSQSQVGSILVFAAGATGNVAPIAVITGSNTGLHFPSGIALNPVNGDIYVANGAGGVSGFMSSITVYPSTANGNVAPSGTIEGPATGLLYPGVPVLDAKGNIYVPGPNDNGGGKSSIQVFAAGSVGNVAPIESISGAKTNLHSPSQVVLDSRSRIWASNFGGHPGEPGVTVYAAGANGNVGPKRVICCVKPQFEGANGIAFDAGGNVYVSNFYSEITVYAAGSYGNIAPMTTIAGSNTELVVPWGITIR